MFVKCVSVIVIFLIIDQGFSDQLTKNSTNASITSEAGSVGRITKKSPESPLCGGVLSCDDTMKYISYKPFDTLASSQRCVWIVHHPKQSTFYIKPQMIGFARNQSQADLPVGLVVTGINFGDDRIQSYYVENQDNSLTLEANVMVITFWTNQLNSEAVHGFILEFGVITSETLPAISSHSEHHIVMPDTYGLKHPSKSVEVDSEIPSKELSIYSFIPRNNMAHQRQMKINYRRLTPIITGKHRCDVQYISVYLFEFRESETRPNYFFQNTLCEDNSSNNQGGDDLILYTIRSTRPKADPNRQMEFTYTD